MLNFSSTIIIMPISPEIKLRRSQMLTAAEPAPFPPGPHDPVPGTPPVPWNPDRDPRRKWDLGGATLFERNSAEKSATVMSAPTRRRSSVKIA
jgi:hypothetical protein